MKRNNPRGTISERGYWLNEGDGKYLVDPSLAEGIKEFLKNENCKSLVDLGCGSGWYTRFFNSHFPCDGYDGHPDTFTNTNGLCSVLDLSYDQKFEKKYDWVMSLEVGEHIPEEYESVFINNLHQNNTFGIILSWAVIGQGGHGHVNCRSNEYIIRKFEDLGYIFDMDNTTQLRSISTLDWFRNTLMVFRVVL